MLSSSLHLALENLCGTVTMESGPFGLYNFSSVFQIAFADLASLM